MSNENQSLKSLSPNFTIPPGSQIVVTKDQKQETGIWKKSGSVGVVVRSPPHNDEPYLVRFHDESEALIQFENLTLRRREIDNCLSAPDDEDLTRYIIYRCQVGSKAFGLSTEDSDDDIRGIYLPPARRHWSLYSLPEHLEFKTGNEDAVFWEFEKFLRLALKANPNILETLWTPLVLELNPIGEKLLNARSAFLSRHLFKTYSGYVLSQFRRMKNAFATGGTYKPKHAMHLIRLLHSGIAALRTGEIMIDVSHHRDQLLKIRSGELEFEQVRTLALALDREFQVAFESTKLPEQPDFELVNTLLIDARNSMTQS